MHSVPQLALLLVALSATACSSGYRSGEDSKDLRRDLDDRTIESRVRVTIGTDEQTANEKIEIECVDGVVYLRGTVRAPAAARRAVKLAAGVDGVRRVIEQTRTVPEAPTVPSASE